jgi:hypothetical protein
MNSSQELRFRYFAEDALSAVTVSSGVAASTEQYLIACQDSSRLGSSRSILAALLPLGEMCCPVRTWPTLGWRSLLRHIYRRQDQWSELVPAQPESEQHACILQFLGLAEHLFFSDLSTLTDKRKRLAYLEMRREYFTELMQKLLPDVMADPDLSAGITAHAIENAAGRIEHEANQLVERRSVVMAEVRDRSYTSKGQLTAILEERSVALHNRERACNEVAAIRARLAELEEYERNLNREAHSDWTVPMLLPACSKISE